MKPCALCGNAIERAEGESMPHYRRRIFCSPGCYNTYRADLPRRLLNYTVDANGCHVWNGARNKRGYGQIKVEGKQVGVHIVSYTFYVGPIKKGKEIDHTCDNPPCMNPAHLKQVTHRQNILRSATARAAVNARKTHCPRGHKYSRTNTYRSKDGRRYCRKCERERLARRYQQQKAHPGAVG